MSLRECVEAGIPLGPNGGVIHHAYQKDRHSGAGNCVCGRHEAHRLHERVAMPVGPLPELRYEHSIGPKTQRHRLMAYDGDARVGYMDWNPGSDVENIEVHPDYQRRGVGTEMWNRARGIDPDVVHSTAQTPAGKAWAEHTAAAEHHGAMVALYPRADDAYRMAVPNGEPVKELHLTLVYLGEDASQMPPPDTLHLSIARLADAYTVIDAPVIGRAIFDEGAVVYLIGDNPQLPDLHDDVLNACHSEYEVPRQHHPWKPHCTIGYEISPRQLDFKGMVLFDRIGVAFGGKTKYFPLMGATTEEYED